jgi:LPXTG-site transpeptidase (sortase) family protein
MMLNVLVVIMFHVVTTPAPTVRAYEVPTSSLRRTVAVMSGMPNRLVVESVGIDIPVGIGTYDPATETWTLGDDQAYYADNTVPVNNNNGTTLIYGHAREPLFGSLVNMQVGATASVYTDKGQVFHYRYQSMQQYDPYDTSIFTNSGPPLLTLQTCAGAWDIYRSIYTFQYVGQEST